MADLTSVALSISSTLLLQGITFVVLEYPEKLRAAQFELEANNRKQLNRFADDADAMALSMRSVDQLELLQLKLGTKQDASTVTAARAELNQVLSQLRGLEVTSQPFSSHIAKQVAAVERALALAMAWEGEPNAVAAGELDVVSLTLLYSAKAVQRANSNNLEAFWTDMKQGAASLRALSRKYVVSAAGLGLAALLLFSLSLQLLRQHSLLRAAGVRLCWAGAALVTVLALWWVLRRAVSANRTAKDIEDRADGFLKTVMTKAAEVNVLLGASGPAPF